MSTLVERLVQERFSPGSMPRSTPYREGLRAILANRLDGMPLAATPYRVGTPEADAYLAGWAEGKELAATAKELIDNAATAVTGRGVTSSIRITWGQGADDHAARLVTAAQQLVGGGEVAAPSLPVGFENMSIADARQHLHAQGINCTDEFITGLQGDRVRDLKHGASTVMAQSDHVVDVACGDDDAGSHAANVAKGGAV